MDAKKTTYRDSGLYHIINRGVEQRVVFKEAADYEYFEELMCLTRYHVVRGNAYFNYFFKVPIILLAVLFLLFIF